MTKRILIIVLVASSFLIATLVPQPIVGNIQRLTKTLSLDTLDLEMYGFLGGGITAKFRSDTNPMKWVTISIDPMWHRVVYMRLMLDGQGQRQADSIKVYEGSNDAALYGPAGICYDTRYSSYPNRHYFFVSMPTFHKIQHYYYDEVGDTIRYETNISTGSDYPEAIDFCEDGSGSYWLVYTDITKKKVVIYHGTNKLEYSASELGELDHPIAIAVKRVPTAMYELANVYVADAFNHRVIRLSVMSAPPQYGGYKIASTKSYFLSDYVYPSALAIPDYLDGIMGIYVLDYYSGDLYVLDEDIDYLVAQYQTNPTVTNARHLSFCDGEAGVSELWDNYSGMQYFWIDCEVKKLQILPHSVSQGSYPYVNFYLTGPADSVIITVKNSQGSPVDTMIFREKGPDIYNWELTEVTDLSPGKYSVTVRAVDPYTADEGYPLNSEQTASFTITPAYTWNGFEEHEPRPYENSFLYNNCCSSITAQRVTDDPGNLAHGGSYMFKLSATDTNTTNSFNCLDCKIFDNCNIEISSPTFLSCWIKATEAPAGAENLYISLDGIVDPWEQLKQWDKYGVIIDQFGDSIHGGYHPVPVDSKWHRYIFNLTPAEGETLQKIQFSFWGVPVENTGQFTAYLDDISITNNNPLNRWFPETFGNGIGSSHTGGDENFELDFSLKDENGGRCYGGARIIVDGHDDFPGTASHWLSPAPSIRKNLHPFFSINNSNMEVSWLQYDKQHSLILGFLIDGNWLYYGWNAANHWDEQRFVDMGDETHPLDTNKWMYFTRNIYIDYDSAYGTLPQELQAYRIKHYCRSDWDGDFGGTIKGPVFSSGGNTPDSPNPNVPTVWRPNGGEKWVEGCKYLYGYMKGNDLPKLIATWWTDNITDSSPDWNLVSIKEYQPLSPPLYHTTIGGMWLVPNVDGDKPYCAFKTQGLSMQGLPLPGQMDISDAPFTIVDLLVSQPDDGRQFCSTPKIPGTSPSIGWQANGVCGVEDVDLYYTTQGGFDQQVMASNFMSGGGDIWTSIASGLSPGTYQAVDSFYDPVLDTTYYEYAYVGAYDDWIVPNIPTSGGNLKFVAHDSTGDSAVYIMPQTFNIPFGGATAYSTAQTADKIVTDASQTHLVYADESGNILTSSNSDTYEWEELDTIGQGQLPSLALNDDGDPCAVWVTGTENQQSLAFSRYVQGAWSASVVIAPANPNPTDATRHSESTLRDWNGDTISLVSFKSIGTITQQGPDYDAIMLFDSRFDQSNPLFQTMDTIWGDISSSHTPISSAPAFIIDSYDGSHYAFNWNGSTIYIYADSVTKLENICTSPVLWPCLSATDGNIYLTYGVEVGGETCLIQRWKHPQDTSWRGEDTLYKGSLTYTQTLGGAATLLCSASGELSRLSFDPVEDTTSIVPVGEDTYYPHGALSYLGLEDGLPLIWTQQSGSSFYIATDWHDPDETIFPSYYINAGEEFTPYTQYRDSTVDYGEASVDWGSDSVTYELDNLDPLCSHTLLLEFYFEDQDHYTRKYFITAAGQTDTIDFTTYDLERMTMGIPAGVSDITVKITSDSGSVEVSRLLLYQGEEAGGMMMMSTKEAKKQPIPYVLYQNFPNPFVGTTRIRYALPYDRHVSLKVYDVTGRRVRTLVDDHKTPGIYDLSWDGKDNTRLSLPAGVYFIRFATEDFEQTKKAVLLK